MGWSSGVGTVKKCSFGEKSHLGQLRQQASKRGVNEVSHRQGQEKAILNVGGNLGPRQPGWW